MVFTINLLPPKFQLPVAGPIAALHQFLSAVPLNKLNIKLYLVYDKRTSTNKTYFCKANNFSFALRPLF